MLLLLSSMISFAQSPVTVSGQVLDAKGEPLLGVSIQVKNSSIGAVSDMEGRFKFQAKQGDIIVARMLGMQEQTFTAQNSQPITLKMLEDDEVLDEVVVNGFQVVDRKLFTGAAQRLQMDDIKLEGVADASRMLEGRVAGVTVDNISGTFGTSPKIRIRGNSSINGNNQPLYVVDGVILEDLSNVNTDDFISGNANTLISSSIANINPSDIESYQVLKDASATAIYGARAANGVIVITTKKGKSGALQVNYTGNYSVKIRPTYSQFSLMNSAEEMSVYREMQNKGLIDITTAARAQNYGAMGKMYVLINQKQIPWGAGGGLNEEFLNQYENANTDWFDVLFNDFGLQQQHSLSFTTGTDKSSNYYSISYLNDEGQTIADNVKRLTATARNSYRVSDKFNFGLKLTGSYRDQLAPGTSNREFDPISGTYSRDFDINPLSFALNTSRSMRPYDENGDLEYFRRNYAPFNILEELKYNFIDINVLDVSTQANFEAKPTKNLTVNGVFQMRYASTRRDHTVHERSNQAEAYRADDTQFFQDSNNLLYRDPDNPGLNPVVVLPQGGFNYLDQSDLLSFFNRMSINWSKDFGPNHSVNVLAGEEIRYSDRSERQSTAMGVIYESGSVVVTDPNIVEFFNLQNIDINTFDEQHDRFVGVFLNGGYAFKGKYIANFTVRYDGSNQLGKSQSARYLPTWNVSGAWNIDQERFMSGFDWISELKLRATYGLSGNLPPNASAILNLQPEVTIRPTDVEPYLYIEDLTNEDLTWEKLNEFNVGMDLGLWNSRVTTSTDYYYRQSFDLIGQVLTSGIGGQSLKYGNFADMESHGFEFTLNTINIQSNAFSWRTNFNIGYTRDQITNLDYGPRLADALDQNGAAVLGGPRRGLFSARFAGLTVNGIPTYYGENDQIVTEIDLQEREGLASILKYEGPSEPRGGGGFSNTFTYKGLSLSVLMTFKYDYKIRLNDSFRSSYNDFTSLPEELKDRWVTPGDEEQTDVPVILTYGLTQSGADVQAYTLYNQSNVRVANGDYIRLKSVRLAYQIPPRWLEKVKMRNASVSVDGQNLALLYSDKKLNGQDPEFFSSGGVALPQPKMLTFSLNIGL
ncbi:SusC/RagA family TonB-linked outer membrane protein [Reichenbachiella agarivorans]|uniref:SusC/RagA family TonB-linked outer membrane protein n=1 Tax=Reichenbachiella agarivorans TaxID=2979464 RepID=A0ABY6CLM3_9BACT|nr:SusC/RagA family TonB-linked outer membrane protein [Reichenbachiella agarivorans]UXP31411.1 SusC/RagA family TonB-linked outer membrane protein [Reichenbachiella agarivorans]